MRRDEIQRKAQDFFAHCPYLEAPTEACEPKSASVIAEFTLELVARAYAEAARFACDRCFKGNAPAYNENDDFYVHFVEGTDQTDVCSASAIHGMKDSLTLEV